MLLVQDHLTGLIGNNSLTELDNFYAAEWDIYIGNSLVFYENPKCPGGPFLKATYDDYNDEYGAA